MAGISSFIGQKRRLKLTRSELITVLKNPTIPVTSLDQATNDILDNFGSKLLYYNSIISYTTLFNDKIILNRCW